MNKEELEKEAEEYAEGMAKYYESAHGSIPSQFEKYLRRAVEFGYNKANEWHDLRKDPNDLPKFRQDIFVTCEYRSKLKKKRETFEWDYKSDMPLHAIAWCEIPQFKE